MENNTLNSEDILDDEDILEEEDILDSLTDEDEYDEVLEYDDDFSTSDYVIINLVDTWKSQQQEDRKLKSKYGIWIMLLLIAEIVFIGGVLIAIGLEVLTFDEWVINAFILTVFGQIMGIVYIIVKNLFTDGNQIIDIIKEYIK